MELYQKVFGRRGTTGAATAMAAAAAAAEAAEAAVEAGTAMTQEEADAEAFVAGLVRRALNKEQVSLVNVRITPVLARALMKRMVERNRKIGLAALARLVRSHLRARLLNNGHPIVFAWSGRIIDGQHRLTMVIDTGRAVVLDIRLGIDPAAFVGMDNGKVRSGADTLFCAEVDREKSVAAAARLVNSLQAKTLHDAERRFNDLPNDLLLTWVQEHPDIELAVREGRALTVAYKANEASASAAFFLIAEKHGAERARLFFRYVRGDVFTNKKEPAARLNTVLKTREVSGRIHVAAAIINAWNLAEAGRTRGDIVLEAGVAFPEVL